MNWIKRIGLVAVLLLGLAGAGVGAVYVGSERIIADVERVPGFELTLVASADVIEHGRHIARTRGCFGCHGQQLEGMVFDEWGWSSRSVAPNIAKSARAMDDAALEAVIRQGIGTDGRALWSMPSYNFVHLTDDDLSALILFLRSAEIVDSELPSPSLGLRARWSIVTGAEEHMAAWGEHVPAMITGPDDDPAHVRGEYIAMTTCNECHGFDLRGNISPYGHTPDLAMVRGYDFEQFTTLMKTGTSLDGRDQIPLMSMIARDRFGSFTDQELEDLYAFLTSLADRPVPEDVFWRSFD